MSTQQWHWGKLITELKKGSFTNPSICLVDVYHPDESSNANPRPLIRATDEALLGITIINRDSSIDAKSGSMCKIENDQHGEWSFKWIGE